MKSILKIMMLPVAAVLILAGCTQETSEIRLDPKLGTTKVFNITSNSATVTGFVVAEGEGFTTRGVCYDKQPAPTTSKSTAPFAGPAINAAYNVTLTDLDFAQTYFARAFATGPAGTVYGEELTFTTLPVVATVTTVDATDVEGTTAVSGGSVTADGGSAVTARGVCFGTTTKPTIDAPNGKTVDGAGLGSFVSNLSGLKGLTKYYARAYATNSAGTAYGNEITFTTLVSVREWYVPGDYVAASYPGSGLADWAPDKSPMVKSNEANPNNVEGYVYMANASNNFKFASQPNWDGPNYGASGTAGVLSSDPNAGNNNLPQGFYKLNVNAGVDPMTYTAVAMTWGVIGDINGWSAQVPLTYDPALHVWKGAMHMPVGGWKFRANDNWDYNYGKGTGSNDLVAGSQDNLSITVADDYAITLDLSQPLAYTYRADRWGIVGSATGSWDVDQNMSWDAVNKVFIATIDLTAGEIKFRANDDWGYNFGGSLTDLSSDNAPNIPIAEAGNYKITLDPWARVATVTKN
ncbi:MAG TPA: SusF/SusE family outer membrane protein [Bacteroidales bacterium]|nr:SusF/SusE family outer membrane protein [Bacteroidales bacterium]HNX82868.1 SusF/SusE family outer membrane protein [Bacteroidales bacterium]HPS97116.1 SusF/SusE family outer membrane protein [Bacteroidales bacterium]